MGGIPSHMEPLRDSKSIHSRVGHSETIKLAQWLKDRLRVASSVPSWKKSIACRSGSVSGAVCVYEVKC